MIRISKANQENIMQRIREGKIDAAMLSTSSLVDDIILSMHRRGVLNCLNHGFEDRRSTNSSVPFDLTLALSIAAKMRVHTSLTDIPYALTDHKTICELGYSMYETKREAGTGLMSEGTIRALIGKYTSQEMIKKYNHTVQNHILPHSSIESDIHVLDCTPIEVETSNSNFEGSAITYKDGKKIRGYKLSTIRGIVKDSGIIEDIRFGAVNIHDLKLSEQMIRNSPVLKPGDILINDRGFISRDVMNYLKSSRGVDTYVPLKSNMHAHQLAVQIAKEENKWTNHPNKKRKSQKIALVTDLGAYWESDDPQNDVEFNACVVWDTEADKPENEYFVFITTDLTKTAKQIIQTYELRPVIEEDYRQIKDFWKIEDFKSTNLATITFHIVCVLLGYLFFQLYTMLPEGEKWAGKTLPVILKNYRPIASHHLIIYSGDIFGVLSISQMMELYSECAEDSRAKISEIMKGV